MNKKQGPSVGVNAIVSHTTMSIYKFLGAWELREGQWEGNGFHGILIYQPLETELPEKNVKPHCCYLNTVIFYDKDYNELKRTTHFDLSGELLLAGDYWYEITGGRVIFRCGKWTMEFYGYKNTRKAAMMNAGFGKYKE